MHVGNHPKREPRSAKSGILPALCRLTFGDYDEHARQEQRPKGSVFFCSGGGPCYGGSVGRSTRTQCPVGLVRTFPCSLSPMVRSAALLGGLCWTNRGKIDFSATARDEQAFAKANMIDGEEK